MNFHCPLPSSSILHAYWWACYVSLQSVWHHRWRPYCDHILLSLGLISPDFMPHLDSEITHAGSRRQSSAILCHCHVIRQLTTATLYYREISPHCSVPRSEVTASVNLTFDLLFTGNRCQVVWAIMG